MVTEDDARLELQTIERFFNLNDSLADEFGGDLSELENIPDNFEEQVKLLKQFIDKIAHPDVFNALIGPSG